MVIMEGTADTGHKSHNNLALDVTIFRHCDVSEFLFLKTPRGRSAQPRNPGNIIYLSELPRWPQRKNQAKDGS